MTDFTIKVRPDQGDTGTNKIEVFLDTDPKREIMVLTDRADDIDEYEDEPRPEDTALYYAVERIAQLETERDACQAAEEAQIALREKAQAQCDVLAKHVERFKQAAVKASMNGYGQDSVHHDDSWIDELDRALMLIQHHDAKRSAAEGSKTQ